MSGSDNNADKGAEVMKFTEGETRLLSMAWLCMEGEPKIDFDRLAPMSGYTVGSAKVTFAKVKRKIKAAVDQDLTVVATPKKPSGGASAATPKVPKTPKTPRAVKTSATKRKASAANADNNLASPTKRVKATPKGKGKTQVKSEDADDSVPAPGDDTKDGAIDEHGGDEAGFTGPYEGNLGFLGYDDQGFTNSQGLLRAPPHGRSPRSVDKWVNQLQQASELDRVGEPQLD